ncbi:hypothetical protein H0H92_005920 [Tricholoma furcatifolium]|nr:hypothetical protein H0H92_005920 [Tricholoma furcatifolium]
MQCFSATTGLLALHAPTWTTNIVDGLSSLTVTMPMKIHWCFSPMVWLGYKPANSSYQGSPTLSDGADDNCEVIEPPGSEHAFEHEEKQALIGRTTDADIIFSSPTSSTRTIPESIVLEEPILQEIASSFDTWDRNLPISRSLIESAPYVEMNGNKEEDKNFVEPLSGHNSDGETVLVPESPPSAPQNHSTFSFANDSLTVDDHLFIDCQSAALNLQSHHTYVTVNDPIVDPGTLDMDFEADSLLLGSLKDLPPSSRPQTPVTDTNSPVDIVRMRSLNSSVGKSVVELPTEESLFDEMPLDALYPQDIDSPVSGVILNKNTGLAGNASHKSMYAYWEEQVSSPSAPFDDFYDHSTLPFAEVSQPVSLSSAFPSSPALKAVSDSFVVNNQIPPMLLSGRIPASYDWDALSTAEDEGDFIFSGNDDVLLTPKASSSTRVSCDILPITMEELEETACVSPSFWDSPVDAKDLTFLQQPDIDDSLDAFAELLETQSEIGQMQLLSDEPPWSPTDDDQDEPEYTISGKFSGISPSSQSQWTDYTDFLSDVLEEDREEDWLISSEEKDYMRARKMKFDASRNV